MAGTKLLILGAGGHGKVVAEIAEAVGYETIDFLDDCNSDAVGKLEDAEKLKDRYDDAFVGLGNNRLRGELIQNLRTYGYQVPVLIHPSAYVSRSATIGAGTAIEPKAIVNANSCIGEGCIISVGAIVDHNVEIGDCCHINAGAIVKAGGTLENYQRLDAGEIAAGYQG